MLTQTIALDERGWPGQPRARAFLHGFCAGRLNAATLVSGASGLIDRTNFRASLWAILYSLLLAIGCGAMIEAEVSYFVVVPVGLFVFPLLASLPFLIRFRSAGRAARD